jgi:hypothetical protein
LADKLESKHQRRRNRSGSKHELEQGPDRFLSLSLTVKAILG